jgi:hypothetical protein
LAPGTVHVLWHNKAWILAWGMSTLIGIIIFNVSFFRLFVFEIFYILFYLIAENLVSPDIDLISISGQDGRLITFGEKLAVRLKRFGFFAKIIGFFVGLPSFFFSLWSAFYAYGCQFFGGHRSWLSHSPVVGTIGRMIWFNILILGMMWILYLYGVSAWTWKNFGYEFYLDVWLIPALLGQFLAWNISDGIHLTLDSKWAKGKLY